MSAPDIMAAAEAWLEATPGVVAAFGHAAATPKFWADFAESFALPYLVTTEIGEAGNFWSEDGNGLVPLDALGMFQISAFAAGKRPARALGNLIAAALDDAPLEFDDGTLLELRATNQFARKITEAGPGTPAVYQRILVFTYRVQRHL